MGFYGFFSKFSNDLLGIVVLLFSVWLSRKYAGEEMKSQIDEVELSFCNHGRWFINLLVRLVLLLFDCLFLVRLAYCFFFSIY